MGYKAWDEQKREEKFLEKIVVDPETGCWLWTGSTYRSGYGKLWDGEKLIAAHRWSYRHWKGPLIDDLEVCHTCDTLACANPDHLFLGTTQDNADDKVAKGRQKKGEQHKNSKLTWDIVNRIREEAAAGATQHALAQKYDVNQHTIWSLLNGITWKLVSSNP